MYLNLKTTAAIVGLILDVNLGHYERLVASRRTFSKRPGRTSRIMAASIWRVATIKL